MYIKIKDPEFHSLLLSTIVLSLIAIILMAIISYCVMVSNWHDFWTSSKDLFLEMAKEEKELYVLLPILAGAIIIGLCAIPFDWYKKRAWRKNTDRVTALEFTPENIFLHTPKGPVCLYYPDTSLEVTVLMTTVRSKNNSHAAIKQINFAFQSPEYTTCIAHVSGPKVLYQFVPYQDMLRSLLYTFNCEHGNTNQLEREACDFLAQQIQNERQFGMHCKYRRHWVLFCIDIVFIWLGLGWVKQFPSLSDIIGVAAIPGIVLLITGILLARFHIKDYYISRQLKKIRRP